jgi:hypothetical protein
MRRKWSIVLAMGALLTTSSAWATSKKLPVTLRGQETSMWCWAAAGQMVMQYLGAVNVRQCDEANKEFGRTDCCNSPVPDACVHGGHTEWDKYNFDVDYANGALSFAGLKAEIDANRPVEFAWSWTGGGGHVMVVIGYDTANTTVRINNPWPPNVGAEEVLTYSRYVSDTDHTHQDDAYHIHDVRQCYSDFHDMDAGDFQACYNYQALRDRYPVTLAAYDDGGLQMAGSFQYVDNRPVHHLMTAAQFQTQFNTLAARGWRPESVNVVSTSSGPRFTAIWTPIEAPFVTYFGMTQATFVSNWQQLHDDGYLNTDLFAYEDNGTKFVATWVKKPSAGYATYVNLTAADYNAKFSDFLDKGMQPTRFAAYPTPNGTRYAAIWQAQSNGFYHYYGMTSSSYQSTYNTLSAQGYRLSQISALVDRFSAIWVK